MYIGIIKTDFQICVGHFRHKSFPKNPTFLCRVVIQDLSPDLKHCSHTQVFPLDTLEEGVALRKIWFISAFTMDKVKMCFVFSDETYL